MILNNDNDESRRIIETCYRQRKTTINPIIAWTDADVWNFIHGYNLPYCCLYDEGHTRIGCIGCPMASREHRIAQFTRWPKYYDAYLRAFARMLEAREQRGKQDYEWQTPEQVMKWWLEDTSIDGQMSLFEDENEN